MSATQAEHPFLAAIRTLPDQFPEIGGSDELAQIARVVIVPALRVAAKKHPDEVRTHTVAFLARFVRGLGIAAQEIYSPAEIGAARAALEAHLVDVDQRGEPEATTRVGDVAPIAPLEPDVASILAGETDT